MEKTEDADDKMDIVPTTEADAPDDAEPVLTEDQWPAMKGVLDHLYTYRDAEGHDPSHVFHKNVNRRNIPSYYDVIKEPIAMSNIKTKLANREYTKLSAFVRDCALIWHNAHTYNRPDAGVYQDASTLKTLMEKKFQTLVEGKVVEQKYVDWPDLGEIPEVEDVPEDEEEGEEEEEDEEEEDEEEDAPKRKRRGRPSVGGRRSSQQKDGPGQKKRGRPPKVDTPMDARIKNVLKGLRRFRDAEDLQLIRYFEKLPDKNSMKEYYDEIKHPMSVEMLKRKQKRKQYETFEQFISDVDLMFQNAREYNEDGSEIFEAATELKTEAKTLAETERNRPDSELGLADGRIPRPDGIMHHDERWQVGDWVHLNNPNDVTKPIVAEIFKCWADPDGSEWVNACWYFRPEQTVHQHEKHFWPAEVVKTGRYEDHPIDDVIGRSYVMFYTRYPKGRPQGIAPDTEVYVCEARYNEEKKTFNKIKTWASCLPEEVRGSHSDYAMDLFPGGPRKIKKVPSPLLHMLKDDDKDASKVSARWGADNAPPVVGAIHKGMRDENQSPPPEPTPPPPTPPPVRQVPPTPTQDYSKGNSWDDEPNRAAAMSANAGSQPIRPHSRTSYTPQHPDQSASPVSHHRPTNTQYPSAYSSSGNHPALAAATPQHHSSSQNQYATAQNRYYASQQTASGHPPQHIAPSNRYHASTPLGASSHPPPQQGQRPNEVFTLPANAQNAIPPEIRERFQRDENGNVLFFSKAPVWYREASPPLDGSRAEDDGRILGHSAKYRAAMLRKKARMELRRKEHPTEAEGEREEVNGEPNGTEPPPAKKLARRPQSWAARISLAGDEGRMTAEAMWPTNAEQERERKHEESRRENEEIRRLLAGPTVYLDDVDPRT